MHQGKAKIPPSAMTDIDARRAKIDQAILTLQLRISDLRTQRNALAPISSLPEDVLAEVFQSTNDGLSTTCNSYRAFLVSWVCRLWRKVAVRSQRLWNYIDTPNPRLARLCLQRAPFLQLEFQLHHLNPSPSLTKLFGIIMPELKRTSTLSLRAKDSRPLLYLDEFATYPAPTLHSVSLKGVQLPEDTWKYPGIPPALRSLSLSKCRFHWDAPIFGAGLTSLIITLPSSPMSLSGFLNMLRHVTGLQTLHLANVFKSVSSSNSPLQRLAVHLPALTSFALSGCSTRRCTDILLGLTFTSQANVVLNLHDDLRGGATSSLPTVLQLLSGPCTEESPWVIDTISVLHGNCSQIQLLSERHSDWTTTKEAVVRITMDPCTIDASQILHSFLALNRDNLETVILDTDRLDVTITDDVWKQVFGGLQSVTKLKVRQGYANSFIDYLAREGRSIAAITSAMVIPPLTKEEARAHISFKELKILEIFRFSEQRVGTNFGDFLLAMTLRKEFNLKLVGLTFASCHFREFNMVALGGTSRLVHVCHEAELQEGEDKFISSRLYRP
ncbi:hypothetical protein BDN72DRAFT_845659 [Pluteus cervinus]|uniref:Uncharacterized protein n=1 Tax=Pluteus cervinus TaxID=181527 RepID=A0ACD3AHF3_9AGAR|nr:hypothetical protein BDN72DRAFT_845659 [Pluteus cervinus]